MVLLSISGWLAGIALVLLATAGVVLLMLGIILKKRWQLFTGIGTLIASFILMIVTIVLFASANTNNYDISESEDFSSPALEEALSDSNSQTKNEEIEIFESCISGHIKDADNSLTYIRIYPDKSLLNNGVQVLEIKTYYKSANTKGKSITLNISFEKEFHKTIKFSLFSDKNIEIGSAIAIVDQNGGNDMNITFNFDSEVPFEIADHATLALAE